MYIPQCTHYARCFLRTLFVIPEFLDLFGITFFRHTRLGLISTFAICMSSYHVLIKRLSIWNGTALLWVRTNHAYISAIYDG